MIYELPADLADTDDRLHNWGQWARYRRPVHAARSAEGRFRRPAGDDDPRRTPELAVNTIDASRVDATIAPASGFPKRFAALLVAHYVIRADYRVTCRRNGIRWQDYRAEMLRAMYAARNCLTRQPLPVQSLSSATTP